MTKLSLQHSHCGRGRWPEASNNKHHSGKVAGHTVGSSKVSQAALHPEGQEAVRSCTHRAIWGDPGALRPSPVRYWGRSQSPLPLGFMRCEQWRESRRSVPCPMQISLQGPHCVSSTRARYFPRSWKSNKKAERADTRSSNQGYVEILSRVLRLQKTQPSKRELLGKDAWMLRVRGYRFWGGRGGVRKK